MATLIIPPGPTKAFNLNANEQSFELIGSLLNDYGDVVSLPSADSKPSQTIVNHPDCIKEIFVTEHKTMQKGAEFDRVKMLLGNGLIVSDGEFWKRQKRMITPIFHKDILKIIYEVMRECNIALLKKWQVAASEQEPINVTKDTCYLALEIILRALFSDDFDKMSVNSINPFFVLADYTERDLDLVVKFRSLTKYVKQCIQNRRDNNRYPADYLSMLMQVEDKITRERMTDKEVVDEVMTLIVAAHETTAATLNWVWYFISKNKDIATKVNSEIGLVSDQPPSIDQLQKMPYIRHVIDEALRIYPPVWLISREALKDVNIGEYHFESGTNFFISPYYIHRHSAYWERPNEFMPERFEPENNKKINRYTYFPFSMGQRRCSGEIFALLEMHVHIAYISKHLHLEVINEDSFKLEPRINLRAQKDFHMMATHRH